MHFAFYKIRIFIKTLNGGNMNREIYSNLGNSAFSVATLLYTRLRRVSGRVVDVVYLSENADYAKYVITLAYTYTRNEVAIKEKQTIADIPVVKSTLKLFKVTATEPKYVTTSLYNQIYAIDLATYDKVNNRVMLNTGNGTIQQVEPLTQTNTHYDVKVNAQEIIAPIAKVMQLATVQVYQNNVLINTLHLNQDVQVEEANIFQKIIMWFSSLFSSDANKVKVYPLQS